MQPILYFSRNPNPRLAVAAARHLNAPVTYEFAAPLAPGQHVKFRPLNPSLRLPILVEADGRQGEVHLSPIHGDDRKRGFTDMGWEIVPEVFTQHLVRLAREYNPPPMFITENGMANADRVVDGRVPDEARIAYLSAHLQALSTAMSLGADVRGYFYWSLLDNFEWNSGYAKRFGLVHDFIAQHHARR